MSILTILIFLPTIGALILAMHKWSSVAAKTIALVATFATLIIGIIIADIYKVGAPQNFQLIEKLPWIPTLGISYHLAVDGVSLLLVLLTVALMPLVVLQSNSIEEGRRGYLINMLLLQSGMLGTFLALDMFLFYLFWELMLIPMYFIIGIWGGTRRIYATFKFVLYTVVGSVLMLAAILTMVYLHYKATGIMSFDYFDHLSLQFGFGVELLCFLAFLLAFAIKIPLFPFHTWLPDAHVEAPTGGSVVLAGVLLKVGIYGLFRFAIPFFPRAFEFALPYLLALAVIGIIYGALVAWVQTDIKKLVAYSSVSHLGFCVLGLLAMNAISLSGAMLQLVNHGISTGALFFMVGVLYDRRHTRMISEYGGLAARVPLFSGLFLFFTLSSIAVPLTNGFVGEFLILTGSYQTFPIATVISTSAVVLGAVYMLTMYMKTVFGPLDESKNGALADVSKRELCFLLPLVCAVIYFGLFPGRTLNLINQSTTQMMSIVDKRSTELKAWEVTSEAGGVRRPQTATKNIKPILDISYRMP